MTTSNDDREYCHGCERPLGDTPPIYLELHRSALTWHQPGTLAEDVSQGCFAFGPTCARKHAAGRRLTLPAGCKSMARERVSGAMRAVYEAEVAGIDADTRWVVMCEDHSSILESETLRDARSTSTLEFCEDCRDGQPPH